MTDAHGDKRVHMTDAMNWVGLFEVKATKKQPAVIQHSRRLILIATPEHLLVPSYTRLLVWYCEKKKTFQKISFEILVASIAV